MILIDETKKGQKIVLEQLQSKLQQSLMKKEIIYPNILRFSVFVVEGFGRFSVKIRLQSGA